MTRRFPLHAGWQRASGTYVWADRPEVRIYPNTRPPVHTSIAKTLHLTAPGTGHDVHQLVISTERPMGPIAIRFSEPTGPGKIPVSSLTYRVARSVTVKEVVDKTFPLGHIPDPLVEPGEPEPVEPGENAIFWIEWSPPRESPAGLYRAEGGLRAAESRWRQSGWNFAAGHLTSRPSRTTGP